MKRVTVFILAFALISAMAFGIGCAKKPSQADLQKELEKAQVDSNTQGAIDAYAKVVKYYPETEEAAKAQFMIGYLYSNELNDTSMARKAFESFLDRYSAVSDTQLVLSAKMELQTLGMGAAAYEKMLFDGNGAQDSTSDKETAVKPVE